MTVKLDKYIRQDLDKIIFEDKAGHSIYKEYDGYTPAELPLPKELRRWIIAIAWHCYIQGGKRTVQQINRAEEDKARKAQDRAIKKIMSMKL